MKTIYRYLLLFGIAGCGVLMIMTFYYDNLKMMFPCYSYEIINILGTGIYLLWTYLHLPPHGDAGIVWPPIISVGLQWVIILAVVFFLTRKKRHKKEKNPSHDGD